MIVDSSVLIAFINQNDALHSQALNLDLTNGAINQLIFAEVANVLQKRAKNSELVFLKLKETLENMPFLEITDADMRHGLVLFEKNYSKISFTDAVIIVQARKLNEQIASFDDNLKKLV